MINTCFLLLCLHIHLKTFAARFAEASPTDVSPFVNAETAEKIYQLWQDKAIQSTYERRYTKHDMYHHVSSLLIVWYRNEYQLPGSVDYLLNNVRRLLIPGMFS